MSEVNITTHAAQRYAERIGPSGLTHEQARAAIRRHEKAIITAAKFGCSTVRLPNGGRLVLDGLNVVTALGRGQTSRATSIPFAARAR